MIKQVQDLERKINSLIWHLASSGVVLLMLGILIVWTDFMLRLVVGMIVIVISYAFFVLAYRLWHLKGIINKYLKF